MSISLSIIIPTLNRQDSLIRTLDSIFKYKPNYCEVIVVDQSDNKNSSITEIYSDLVYIYIKKKSLPNARNLGIKKSIGDVLLFIDDDMVIDSKVFDIHLKAHEDRNLGILSGRIIQKGDDKWADINVPTIIDFKTAETKANFDLKDSGETQYSSGGHFSVKKSTFNKVGLFNSFYGANALYEDVDMSIRVKNCGFKLFYKSDAVTYHFSEHSGGCHDTDERRHLLWRLQNQTLFYLLHCRIIPGISFLKWQKNLIEFLSRKKDGGHSNLLIIKSLFIILKAALNSIISRIVRLS